MAKQLVNYGTSATAPWKALLQKSLAENKSLPYSKYMQLATANPASNHEQQQQQQQQGNSTRQSSGTATRQICDCRGFYQNTDLLTFVTDRRSSKIADLAANPHIELCWYFPNSREQYRLSGVVDIITHESTSPQLLQARQETWARMSDSGRSQFMWPQPGQPRMPADESLFLQPAPEGSGPAVDAFCLGVVQVHQVDYVNLYSNQRVVYNGQERPATVVSGSNGSDAATHQVLWDQKDVNP